MSGPTWGARINTVNGVISGAGLLVSTRRVLTCAHVVHGQDRVLVAFPEVPEGNPVAATVIWRGPWQRQGDRGDIAVVELDTLPVGAVPCELAELDALRPTGGRISYSLRARGFPRNLDDYGDYVTVTSSSDRALGTEWLQTDADQAHLQRLARGFSGAGLYLPDSGKVAGMLTDSVLDADRGGYIGRMLPLSTIRRYWTELDDLLPLPWLETPACRAELRAALANAVTKTDIRSMVTSVLPVICTEDFRTPWEAVRYVGESVVGDDSLRKFLVALAPYLDAPALSRLADWALRWRKEWAAQIKVAKPPVTSIVVTLRTPTRNGKSHVQVAARPLVNGQWAAPEDAVTVRRDQVRQKTEQLISSQVSRLRPARLMIEFAARVDDLGLPFDEWHYQEPGVSRPLPLRSVPVVVWNLARLDPGNAMASSRVIDRWQALRDAGKASFERVACSLGYDYQEFYNWLDADEKTAALAYASAPELDWLNAALDIGIPVMVWCRHTCQGDADAHVVHVAALAQLVAALAEVNPVALPAEVMRLRKHAMKPGADERHYGRHLTLFWDDPARLPDPPLGGWS